VRKEAKIIAMLLLLFSIASHIWAQQTKPSVFEKLEFRIGAGGFWTNSNTIINYKPERFGVFTDFKSTGWSLMLDLEINDKIGFSTGFKTSPGQFSSDSVNYPTTTYPDQWTSINYDFQEWEIPLRFRYYISKGSIKPYLDISISINQFSRFTYSGTNYLPWVLEGEDFTIEEESKNNASYDVGGGVYIDLTDKISLALDARYQFAELYWRHRREIVIKRPVFGAGIYWKFKEKIYDR